MAKYSETTTYLIHPSSLPPGQALKAKWDEGQGGWIVDLKNVGPSFFPEIGTAVVGIVHGSNDRT